MHSLPANLRSSDDIIAFAGFKHDCYEDSTRIPLLLKPVTATHPHALPRTARVLGTICGNANP